MDKLFVYNTPLNTKPVQRQIWGEPKEGKCGTLMDYELFTFENSVVPYIKKYMGETVAGKMYELTSEEMAASDLVYGDAFKRKYIFVDKDNAFYVHVLKEE